MIGYLGYLVTSSKRELPPSMPGHIYPLGPNRLHEYRESSLSDRAPRLVRAEWAASIGPAVNLDNNTVLRGDNFFFFFRRSYLPIIRDICMQFLHLCTAFLYDLIRCMSTSHVGVLFIMTMPVTVMKDARCTFRYRTSLMHG